MGNHEYCTECGMSSFHYGEPCPPRRKAAKQSEEARIKRRVASAERAARALCKKLEAQGIPATM